MHSGERVRAARESRWSWWHQSWIVARLSVKLVNLGVEDWPTNPHDVLEMPPKS